MDARLSYCDGIAGYSCVKLIEIWDKPATCANLASERKGKEIMTHWRSQTEAERKKLAEKLRHARETANLTQREVARRLTIPQSTISELENGQRRLDVAELLLLAELYGRSAMWFLEHGHGTGEESNAGGG